MPVLSSWFVRKYRLTACDVTFEVFDSGLRNAHAYHSAKLGGTPYVISAPRAVTKELVIGIGSAHVKASRLTMPERVVGITTVFSADGNYILSNRSSEADYADYPRELLRSLEAVIDDVKARNGWLTEDALRLIFHVFKPLKDTEAQAVKALVEKLTRQYAAVEFAFVRVSDEHDWAIFDQSSAGVSSARRSGPAKGRLVPGRGHAVQISRSEMLLSVTGPPRHATPDDTKSTVAAQIGSWLTGAAQRISPGNTPGNLDGLFARHVLDGRPVTGLTWDVNPASPQWPDQNRHRLDHAPVLASLGYSPELSTAGNLAAARAALASGLTRLMRRNPFQHRLTFVNDTRFQDLLQRHVRSSRDVSRC